MVPLRPVPTDVPGRMLESLAPRGPDDQGWTLLAPQGPQHGKTVPAGTWDQPFLLHRRLAILDLSEAGHQPMTSPDGRHLIVYNGEVYNFQELRTELEGLGYTFRTQTDTEVVLTAYLAWGPAALERFVGMFALAIIDRDRERLFLARDHFGIKPLFYAHGPWGFAFASDIQTLLAVPDIPRVADAERLHRYLTTGSGISSYGDGTLFRAVKQVPPAHWLEVDLVDAAPGEAVAYWQVDQSARADVSYAEAVQEVRARFLESVRIHLRSDVPCGAALSGGIDSSAIVAAVRHHTGPQAPLHTFTYLADDPKVSEERWARMAEEAHGATGHGIYPDVVSFRDDLPRLIAAQGEPFGSTSIYAQYCVFRAARANGIKVMLDGQGADELLAGYRHYFPARLHGLLRRGRLVEAARLFRAMIREPDVRPVALAAETLIRLVPRRLVTRVRKLLGRSAEGSDRWLDETWFSARGVVPGEASRAPGSLGTALHDSVRQNSLPHLLRYEDRNSMAHSVESRVPFLDHRLVSYLFSLPEEYLLGRDATTKRVFRDAMRGLVPDAILDRRDKVGFQTTERDWMMALDDWVEATLASETAEGIPFLRQDRMLAEWRAVKAGRRAYSWTIWRWVNLIEWTRVMGVRYDERPVPQPLPIPLPSVAPDAVPVGPAAIGSSIARGPRPIMADGA